MDDKTKQLRRRLIRLAYQRPELREQVLPLVTPKRAAGRLHADMIELSVQDGDPVGVTEALVTFLDDVHKLLKRNPDLKGVARQLDRAIDVLDT